MNLFACSGSTIIRKLSLRSNSKLLLLTPFYHPIRPILKDRSSQCEPKRKIALKELNLVVFKEKNFSCEQILFTRRDS